MKILSAAEYGGTHEQRNPCMIELDGALGDSGGQILRSALSLSICTQQPFRIANIRIHRDMAGLLRQHLAAVNAAADIANAETSGDQLGSRELIFRPRQCRAGAYAFDVGAAGCGLVLQAILPPLLLASAPSTVRISGCTHHRGAPPFDFLQRTFVPVLQQMGAQLQLTLLGYGFHPTGGGGIQLDIAPAQLDDIELHERGARISHFAEAYVSGYPTDVAQRGLMTIGRHLHWNSDQLHLRALPDGVGQANVITITLAHQHITEVFTGIGEHGVRAETIAQSTANEVEHYLARSAPVGPHLADQLLLPLAIRGRGSFTTTMISAHFHANAAVIEQFSGRRVVVEPRDDAYRVTIA